MAWSVLRLAAVAAGVLAAVPAGAQFYRPDDAPRYEERRDEDRRDGDRRYDDRRDGYGREGDRRDGYGRDRYDQRPDERPDRYGRGYAGGGGGGRGGSYQRSCGEARQDGSTLTAICGDGRGGRVQSSIDLNRCGRSDVANNAGFLQCGNIRANGRRVQ